MYNLTKYYVKIHKRSKYYEKNEIFKQALEDWKELRRLYSEHGITKYGIVRGFIIDGVLQEDVAVNMGDGQILVFDSIEYVELNIKRE